MATLAGFRKRIKLTIDHTKIGENLSHFPLAVHLNSAQGEEVFAEIGASGRKIAFTKDDGVTQLYAEIERYDNSNQIAMYHVSRSGHTISSSTDTIIYVYYDSTAADNTTYIGATGQAPAEAVWNSNFIMVQHFNKPPAYTASDSTSNDADGVPQGTMLAEDLTNGLGSAFAHDLDSIDDYYTRGTSGMMSGLANMTFETVFNCRSSTGVHYMWTEEKSGALVLYYRIYEGKVQWGVHDGSWHGVASAGVIGTVNKEYVAANLHSTDGRKVYIAGVEDGSDASTATSAGTIVNADICYYRTGDVYSNAIIGELRLSNVCRSAHWLLATNHTLKDTLLTYGDEENLGNALFFSFNF